MATDDIAAPAFAGYADADALARACAEAMLGRDRVSQGLGIRIVEVREGYAHVEMDVVATMINGHGTAHGGVTFSLADSAFAFACNSRNEANVALAATISFTAPGRVGDVLSAKAQERGGKGRTGVYDIDVTNQDGAIVAVFRGNNYRINKTVL